jgi:DNA-3-methyladenine glycosylase
MAVGASVGAVRRGAAGSARQGAAGSALSGGVGAVVAGVAKSRPPTRARGPLPQDFYARPVLEVARELIGCVVEYEGLAGTIVETEAYHESEPACHAFVGVTPRTRTLFDEPGIAYVYRSYGIHALLNAVCEPAGVGAAVLIRALEPLVGIEEMRMRRGRVREDELCSGPGKLTQALGIELSQNGTSLLDGPVRIRVGDRDEAAEGGDARRRPLGRPAVAVGDPLALAGGEVALEVGPRIGIAKAVDLPWRFCVAGNPNVSRPRPTSK